MNTRKFVGVSLPVDFASLLSDYAERSGRSMQEQLHHWSKIARAVEMVFPAPALNKLKSEVDQVGILEGLTSFVMNPSFKGMEAKLLVSQKASQLPIYGSDTKDPETILQYAPGGKVTRGTFDRNGDFVPAAKKAIKGRKQETVKKLVSV